MLRSSLGGFRLRYFQGLTVSCLRFKGLGFGLWGSRLYRVEACISTILARLRDQMMLESMVGHVLYPEARFLHGS